MIFFKKAIFIFILIGLFQNMYSQTPTAEELVGIHALSETQINAIVNPITGTLVYNTDKNQLQSYTGGAWTTSETVSTFVDNLDGTFTYTDESNNSITIGTIGPQGPAGPQGIQGPQGVPGNSTVTNLTQSTTTGTITYTNENNTPQTANVISSDTNNAIEVGSDGGAYLASKIVDVYDANSSYALSTSTFIKIRLNSSRINIGGIYSLLNNEITVSEAGTYEIEYGVAAKTNYWSSIEAKLRINNSDVTATNIYNGGWYKNSTATRKIYQTLNANDVISIWARRVDQQNSGSNSATTLQNGSYLLLKKLN